MTLAHLRLRVRQLQAWFDHHPGNAAQKLHGAASLWLGWRHGAAAARDILRQKQEQMTLAAAPFQSAMDKPPPITAQNTHVAVAAHIDSDRRRRVLLHILRHLSADFNSICVHDMPQNLTADLRADIAAVSSSIQVAEKSTDDLMDMSAYYDAYAALPPHFDYCLSLTDSFVFANSLAPYLQWANQHRHTLNSFALHEPDFGNSIACLSEFRLHNRRSMQCWRALYEVVKDEAQARIRACRGNSIYRRGYCNAIVVQVFEFAFSPFLRGRGMVNAADDPRIRHPVAFLFRPALFREYLLQRGFPIVKLRQLKNRDFAWLHDHLEDLP